jgi:hypothetical protein
MSSQAAATTSSSASVQKTIIHQKMHPKLLTGKEKEHRHKRFEQVSRLLSLLGEANHFYSFTPNSKF